jgi:hypothetical protein
MPPDQKRAAWLVAYAAASTVYRWFVLFGIVALLYYFFDRYGMGPIGLLLATLYVVLTVWLLQRGSPESKELDKAGRESDKDQKVGRYAQPDSPSWAAKGGWRTGVYSSSLAIVMGLIFLLSWLAQSIAGWASFNETRLQRLQDPVSWHGYLANPDFWSRTLQNWQSEFLAVGSMAVLAIYLRQRGSSQSKPVGERSYEGCEHSKSSDA